MIKPPKLRLKGYKSRSEGFGGAENGAENVFRTELFNSCSYEHTVEYVRWVKVTISLGNSLSHA